MDPEMQEVISTMNSCLLTCKNGTFLNSLNSEYKLHEGRNIPYKQFGFSSLEAFVQKAPGIRTTRRGNDLWVESIPTAETLHISRLVAGQNEKSKSRRKRKNMRPGSYNQRGMSYNNVRAANTSANRNYRPKPQVKPYVPPPPQPRNPPGGHRYMNTSSPQTMPSKRLIERAVQPCEDLDYAPGRRPPPAATVQKVAPKTVQPSKPTMNSVVQSEPKIATNAAVKPEHKIPTNSMGNSNFSNSAANGNFANPTRNTNPSTMNSNFANSTSNSNVPGSSLNSRFGPSPTNSNFPPLPQTNSNFAPWQKNLNLPQQNSNLGSSPTNSIFPNLMANSNFANSMKNPNFSALMANANLASTVANSILAALTPPNPRNNTNFANSPNNFPITTGNLGNWANWAQNRANSTPNSSTGSQQSLERPPIAPLLPTPTGNGPQRRRLADRLAVQQSPPPSSTTPFNPPITNGLGNMQTSFSNGPFAKNLPRQTTPAAPSDDDPREKLMKLTLELGRGVPVYKVVKGPKCLYGKVEIGASKFSSYPEEVESVEEAEILAARQALTALQAERDAAQRLPETTNPELIRKRLLEIVDEHNGVFAHKILDLYRELYKENLRKDWASSIPDWPEFLLESGVNDSVLLSRAKRPTNTDNGIFLKPISHVEPGHPELPEEHVWGACVTLVVNTAEIWVRIVDAEYSEKLEALSNEMAQHYALMRRGHESIEKGRYYAIMDDDTWHRVRVLDYDASRDEAEIFFIDLGDEDTVQSFRLHPLDRKFADLSAQAFRMAICGLEEFADCDQIYPELEKILADGVFYVEDVNRGADDEGPIACVNIFDTTGPDDIDVNELIVKKILETIAPSIASDEIPTVHVTHVDTNGDVFIQVKNEGLRILSKLVNKLNPSGLSLQELQKCAVQKLDENSRYFVRITENGSMNWYRGKFMGELTNGRDMKMFLVDFGRTIVVDRSNVLEMRTLSEILADFPPQAIKVRLENVDTSMFNQQLIDSIKELAPHSQPLLLVTVKPSTDVSPPIVELFKKIESDNSLVSINKTIALNSALPKSPEGDGNNNNVRPSRRRLERTNSKASDELADAKSLPAPKISAPGQYFDVHVTMAASPSNFTVQPLLSIDKLRALMIKLQQECLGAKESQPALDTIKEGRLYAAKHSDGDWYRACVLNVVNEHMLTVYFVDYGDVAAIGLNKLRPLGKQFFELPYQAIKARLVGLKPTNIDWSPEDCVKFQQLVVERNFVSVVSEIDADRYLPRDTVLGLSLIDVSTNDDIFIGDVLIAEGRAVASK